MNIEPNAPTTKNPQTTWGEHITDDEYNGR